MTTENYPEITRNRQHRQPPKVNICAGKTGSPANTFQGFDDPASARVRSRLALARSVGNLPKPYTETV